MYDPKWLRDHAEELDRGLARRGLAPLSKGLIALDEKRRGIIAKLQTLQERRNAASKEIGEAKQKKDEARANALMAEVAKIKGDFPALEEEQRMAEAELDKALAVIPNLPAADVPDGLDASANKERHRFGATPKFTFQPKQHFELGEALGLMDFEAAARLSGARFVVLKGALARMERALAQFMLDLHTTEYGYTEVNPPILVRDEVMFGTAQLPKFEADQFFVDRVRDLDAQEYANDLKDLSDEALERATRASGRGEIIQSWSEYVAANKRLEEEVLLRFLFVKFAKQLVAFQRGIPTRLGLIPTAEVPLTNLVRESIVEESALPMRMTACTPCFRAEAGAAGKDTRGMIRQHQFTKVELVSITTPEQSAAEHERMLACAEAVLKRLGLHYRVITLCTGDMGFAANKTYDIEVWLPGQNAFREISSCSNCGEFQARRMQARYRPKDGKGVRHVHTLNGSGVAVGRALIAVMENYQEVDGSISVPEALQPYMGGLKKIGRT